MRPADRAWITLGIGVVAWDVLADETLSEACDRYLANRPWLTRLVVLTVSRHLTNDLRPDPLHYLFLALRMIRRRKP